MKETVAVASWAVLLLSVEVAAVAVSVCVRLGAAAQGLGGLPCSLRYGGQGLGGAGRPLCCRGTRLVCLCVCVCAYFCLSESLFKTCPVC